MTDESKNIPRLQSNSTSFHDPAQIREHAEQKAKVITLPDLDTMTRTEIQQRFYELQVRQIEAELQNEQLRRQLEEYPDRDVFLTKLSEHTTGLVSSNNTLCRSCEKEARRQASLICSLVNSIPDIFFVKDTQGVYLACNSEFARHVGYRLEDIIGKTDYDLYSAADADFFRKNDMFVLEQGSSRQNEEWISYPDGRKILVDTMKTPYRDSDGSVIGIVALCRDITDRNHAEKALLENKNLLEDIINSIPDVLAIQLPDYTIERYNQAGYDMLGMTPEEVVGRKCYELFGRDRECNVCATRKALQSGKVEKTEKYVPEMGIYLDCYSNPVLDEEGNVIQIIEQLRDITTLKEQERKLQESEERLDLAMMVKNEGIWDWNLLSNEIFFDDRYYTMAGYAPNEFPQNFIARGGRVHPDDLSNADAAIKAYLSGQAERFDVEFRFRHKDGSWIWIRGQSKIVKRNKDGTPLRVIGTHTDITERKLAEEALRESNQKLSQLFESSPISLWEQDFFEVKKRIHEIKEKNAGDLGSYLRQRPELVWQLAGMVRVLNVNQATVTLYRAKSKKEFFGGITKILSPESLEGFIEILLAIGRGEKGFVAERDHLSVDGKPLRVQLHWAVVEGYESCYSRVIVSSVDVTGQKQAEAALRKERLRLESIIEGAEVGTWEWNIQTGETVLSETWAEIVGHTLDTLSPVSIRTWETLTHPDDLEQAKKQIERHIAGELPMYDIEIRMLHKAGHWIWIQDRGKVVQWTDTGKPLMMYGTHLEITERKQVEMALQESEKKFRYLFEKAEEGILVAHGKTLEFANPALERILERPLHKIIAEPFINFIHPDDQPVILDRHLRRMQGAHLDKTYDFRIVTPKGVVKWVNINNQVIDWEGSPANLGFVVDITLRKQAEVEQVRLLSAIEQSTDVIVITDPEGIIQYVNPAFEKATGYSRKEAIGQNPRILKSGNQDNAFYQKLWSTITSGETFKGRMVNKRKDGILYAEYATISPVVDAEGRIINFVAVKRDITALEKLQSQLNQAQKMESVGRLAGGVAHDFNNMLAIINGYAEITIDMTNPEEPLYKNLVEIYNAGKRSAKIVSQLMAFARQQTIRPVQLDLNDVISRMLTMLQRLIGENIDLAWHPGSNLWPVKIDPSQVDQIMANLAVNARDAISDIGKLTIETKNVVLDKDYCKTNTYFIPGQYVMLMVSDDGCGIEKDIQDLLFEPFFTTKAIGKGTGLGLSTIYGIVKQNKGFINVYSENGEGTTFTIYLPRHDAQDFSPALTGNASEQLPTGTECILLVEDEPAILKMGKAMIEGLGYTLLSAENPNDALRLALESGFNVDLLITDVIMPGMNGRDLSSQLIKNHPDLKTLYMSGYTADVIAHHGVLDEGVQFIQKPFSLKDLAKKVREAIERG